MRILKCRNCNDELILTKELKECSCGNVIGQLLEDDNVDVVGYSGALIDIDCDSIFELPEISQKMAKENTILYISPTFNILSSINDKYNKDEEIEDVIEELSSRINIKTNFGNVKNEIEKKNKSFILPPGLVKNTIDIETKNYMLRKRKITF